MRQIGGQVGNMLIDKVRDYVEKYSMIKNGDRIVVGISGGADSVCLLKVLKELEYEYSLHLTAVHIHHGIRGDEADRDMNHTLAFCESVGVECKVFHYNIPDIARKNGMTVEEAGRMMRYDTFKKVLDSCGANKIAVAHNLGDNCETIIFNMCRGSKLRGIGGILPIRDNIIRPLLGISRSEIEEYLEQNNIKYIVDSTNLSNDYVRNKIRNVVVPYLCENINTQSAVHIAAASEAALEAEEYMRLQTEKVSAEYLNITKESASISVNIFDIHKIIVKRVIREAIASQSGKLKDISSVHVEDIFALFRKNVGKSVDLPYGLVAERTYDTIRIQKKRLSGNTKTDVIDVTAGNIYLCKNGVIVEFENIKKLEKINEIPEKLYTKWFDCDKIKNTLQIRNRLPGDYMIVDNKGSRKKLKDYFVNEKIPRDKRDEILLLADGNHILWVIGYRISEYYKITEDTDNVLCVNIQFN